jgi:hypothetical protein
MPQVQSLRRSQEAIVQAGGFDWQLFTQENAVTNTVSHSFMNLFDKQNSVIMSSFPLI